MFKLINDLPKSFFSRHWRWQAQYQREESSDGLGVRFQIRPGFSQPHEDFKWFLWGSIGVVDGDESGAERCSFPCGNSVQGYRSRRDFGRDDFNRLSLRLLLGEKYPFPGTFPVDRYSLEPLLPGHTVDPLDCFERGVFGQIYARANSLIHMSLPGSLHSTYFRGCDCASRSEMELVWIVPEGFSELLIFCGWRMLTEEDSLGQRFASPNVFDIENGLD